MDGLHPGPRWQYTALPRRRTFHTRGWIHAIRPPETVALNTSFEMNIHNPSQGNKREIRRLYIVVACPESSGDELGRF